MRRTLRCFGCIEDDLAKIVRAEHVKKPFVTVVRLSRLLVLMVVITNQFLQILLLRSMEETNGWWENFIIVMEKLRVNVQCPFIILIEYVYCSGAISRSTRGSMSSTH